MNLHQLTSEYGPFIVGGSFMAILLWVWARIGWVWKLLTKIFIVEYSVPNIIELTILEELIKNGQRLEIFPKPKIETVYEFFVSKDPESCLWKPKSQLSA